MPEQTPPEPRAEPDFSRYAQLFITLRCGQGCRFCFMRGLGPLPDIGIQDFERLTGILSEAGITEIDLLGGEPTLHPGLMRMAETLKRHGLKASLSTNGSNVKALEYLAERRNTTRIRTGVSINAGTIPAELHEFIIRRRPIVKTVYTKGGTIPRAAKSYLGLEGIEFYLIYMDALSREDLRRTMPFPEFLRKLEGMGGAEDAPRGVHCGFIHQMKNPALEDVRCPAGTTKLSILPDGSAYPCYLLFRQRRFRLGNILTDGFRAIWDSPVLDFFRRFKKNNCPLRECEMFSVCRGGCPAVSLLINNDLTAPEPRCLAARKYASLHRPVKGITRPPRNCL